MPLAFSYVQQSQLINRALACLRLLVAKETLDVSKRGFGSPTALILNSNRLGFFRKGNDFRVVPGRSATFHVVLLRCERCYHVITNINLVLPNMKQ
jgi:hypothetical protein